MKPVEIVKDIYWIGAVDFNKRNFHGYSKSPQGTSYNSYIVCDEKNVIFDTVDEEYSNIMFCRASQVLPLDKVDYIVINHTEKDHAGAIAKLVERCKPEKIITSVVGKKFLEAQFETKGWPIEAVSTGDSISIGKRTITFTDTRMLHWPDSMVSYIKEDKILISNDIFGQNIASVNRFVDQCSLEVFTHQIKEYFYNIILPFSSQVLKILDQLKALGDVSIIAPDHGLIVRTPEGCNDLFELYKELAEQRVKASAVIVYETMWDSTKKMAMAVGAGLEDEGIPYTIIDIQENHHSDVMTALASASGIIVGSATHNNSYMPGIADVLHYMKGLRPQNLVGGAFGSYGWSGEAAKEIYRKLEKMGIDLPTEPIRTAFIPKHEEIEKCYDLGRSIGKRLKELQ